MASLRAIAGCIGISGDFSVVREFFGYHTGVFGHASLDTNLPAAAAAGEESIRTHEDDPGRLSLKSQLQALQGPHVHLDTIRVGIENFTDTDALEIDIAIHIARQIFARFGLGIGRVSHWFLTVAEAGGFTVIDDDDEVCDLLDEFFAPGGGIDVFFVRQMNNGTGGSTPEKDPGGSVVQLLGFMASGIAVAHELVHYLGVDHHLPSSMQDHLMVGGGGGFPLPPYRMTPGEIETVMGHERIQGGC